MERRVLEHDPELMVVQRTELPSALRVCADELVGRDVEQAWLIEAWEAARRGSGQLRVIAGPVDSGRTRLVAQLATIAAGDHAHVVYHRGENDLASSVVGAPGAASSAAVVVLAKRARRQPVLLIVDDVERATAATMEMVVAVARDVERMPAMLVVVVDASAGGSAVEALRQLDSSGERWCELGPLGAAEIARIVESDGIDDPAALLAIVSIADGLPGAACREAATWAERVAGDRVQRAALTSAGALAIAGEARDAVVDEVERLLRVRSRRQRLASEAWAHRSPYVGLAAYGPADAAVFFGREQLVAELAARVLERRIVVVTGSSGSGKSSLVRAGLVPLVQSGRLPGGGPWRVTVTTPGPDPLRTLDELDELDLPGAQLLIIDQFEEALISSPTGVDALVAKLVRLALDPAVDARIVLVVRADQYPHLAEVRHLADLVEESLLVVGRPTEHELRRIVIEPAERAGCRVEPGLVEAIVADVGDSEGALPLVSTALVALWEARVDDVLTLERYRSEGGLAASVERLGVRVLDEPGREPGERERSVRRALMLLVDVTEDGSWVRRRVGRVDVPAELDSAFDSLVDERLVVRHDDDYELVHEVVFRSWSRLARWLDDARADLTLERELRRAARSWDERHRPEDDVWRGARLAAAVEWCRRSSDAGAAQVAEFVTAGVSIADRSRVDTEAQLSRERRATRRLRRAFAAASLLLIGALIATTVAVIARRQASQGRDAAQVARLVAESERAISGRLDLALLLAVEARRRADTIESRGALLTALTQSLPDPVENVPIDDPLPTALAGFIQTGWDQALGVAISDDGSTVLVYGQTNSGDRGLVAFDVDSRVELRRIAGDLGSFRLDPTGTFAVAGDAESVGVYALRAGTDFELVRADGRALTSAGTTSAGLSMSPDGSTASVPFADGSVRFFSTRTGTELEFPGLPGSVGAAGFDPTGLFVYGDSEPGTGAIRINGWELDAGRLVYSSILDVSAAWPPPTLFRVSPDGRVVVGIGANGTVHAWHTHTGALMGTRRDLGPVSGELAAPDSRADPVAFVSGRTIALGRLDGSIAFYDLANERLPRRPLEASGGAIWGIAVSGDMRRLVSVADDGLIRIWQNDDSGPITELVAEDRQLVDVSGDGSRYVLRAPGGLLEVHAADGSMTAVAIPPGAPTTMFNSALATFHNASLSYDGRWVTQSGQPEPDVPGPVRVIDVATGDTIWSDPASLFDTGVVSPDGNRLFLVDDDPSEAEGISVIDLPSGAMIARLGQSTMGRMGADPMSALPTSDGSHVDVTWNDGRVRRLDADTLDVEADADPPFVVAGRVGSDPGTDIVYVAGWPGGIGRVDFSDGDDTWGRSTDPTVLASAALSPDGSVVAALHPFSASIALFDAETLRPLGRPIPIRAGMGGFAFTADGDLLVNGPFGVSRIELDPEVWQATACRVAGRNLTTTEWTEYFGDAPYRATCPDQAPPPA
jgi:WD40 repeat protein/energy-coupling factor transporter ATP-binding protein EcfA2